MAASVSKISSFKHLTTWQHAKDFTVAIYQASKVFPKDELFSLTAQIRRSANSVPANLAEGFARNTAKDKKHFYVLSISSLSETMSHLYIARELGYITSDQLKQHEESAEVIARMINGMIRTAQSKGEV